MQNSFKNFNGASSVKSLSSSIGGPRISSPGELGSYTACAGNYCVTCTTVIVFSPTTGAIGLVRKCVHFTITQNEEDPVF